MNSKRIAAYLMAGAALVLSWLAYENYIYMLGFPDGFVTEAGYALRRLAYIFIAMSILFSSYFVYLGAKAKGRKVLAVSVALYSLTVALLAVLSFFYSLTLDNGQGI